VTYLHQEMPVFQHRISTYRDSHDETWKLETAKTIHTSVETEPRPRHENPCLETFSTQDVSLSNHCRWVLIEIIYKSPIISGIAVFVLKRDVKLQLTNYKSPNCKHYDLMIMDCQELW